MLQIPEKLMMTSQTALHGELGKGILVQSEPCTVGTPQKEAIIGTKT